jgi:peptidoglycan/LPS O-acetylase OafA/YrhL
VKSGSKETPLFLTLDGVRGIGAILVVIGHSLVFWGGPPTSNPLIPFCVDLFFLLSGFVIAFAYEPRFAEGMSAKDFLRQRFVRLYPLYFLGLMLGTMTFLAASVGDEDPGKLGIIALEFIPQLFMLPSPNLNGSGHLYPLNMPSWSLLFELWANVVFVIIWRWLTTRILLLVVALSAIVLAVVTITYGTIDQGPSWWNFWGGFARAMFGFFAGVLVFRVCGSPSAAPKRESWQAVPAIFAVAVLCLIPQTPQTRPFVELGIVCFIGPVLLCWGQSIQPWRPLAAVFAKLGAISYALYVLHYPFNELMTRLHWKWLFLSEVPFTPWVGAGLLAASVAAAWIAEHYYDRPARRFLNGLLKSIGRPRKPAMVHAE